MSPFATLPDLCLLALFRQLPLTDQMTARKVCHRWDDLVAYAARSTRSMAICMGNIPMNEFEAKINSDSLGSEKVVSLLQKEDGSPMFPQKRFSPWNTLLHRGEPDKTTVEAIVATFVNLDKLQVGLIDASLSQIDIISRLLERWTHQLTTLKLYEESGCLEFASLNQSTDRLLAAINGISTLKHLLLNLTFLPFRDLPVISQLEQLRIYWAKMTHHQFAAMLRRHATANTSLRSIEYLGGDSNSAIEQFSLLGDHLLSRFTRVGFFCSWLTESELISTHFRHLTSLRISPPTGTTLRRLLGHLSQLTQLVYLHLNIDFKSIRPDDQPRLLLPQLKSIKALRLDLTTRSHRQLEQLQLIGRTMANLQFIYFFLWSYSKCIDCAIENYSFHNIKANLATAKHCLRQMFAPLKRTCTKLRVILPSHMATFGSADELLAE